MYNTRPLFLNWFHPSSLKPESYLASHAVSLEVLLLLDDGPGHPAPQEFNTEGVLVVYLPPNTTAPIQPLDQGAEGTKAPHQRYLQKGLST